MAAAEPHQWLAMAVISAIYLAYYYGSELFKTESQPYFAAPSGGVGGGTLVLPAGVVITEGPCGSPNPNAGAAKPFTAFGAFICGYQTQTTQRVGPTDAQINADLASGGTVSLQNEQLRTDGYWWYQTIARIGATNPADFEPWDSSKHGYRSTPVPLPTWEDFIRNKLKEFWFGVGLPEAELPWDKIAAVIPYPTVAEPTDWNAWAGPLPYVPVTLHPTATVVTFPGVGSSKGNDVSFPALPGWGSRPGVKPVIPGVKPDVKPGVIPQNPVRPGVDTPVVPGTGTRNPPVVVNPPVVKPQPRGTTISKGGMVRVAAGPVIRANTGIHEPGKTAAGTAVWQAMQVRGRISEFEDGVKAIYKALPASLRRRLKANNGGRSLSTLDMMRAIFRHYKMLDVEAGLFNVMLSQVDDLFAGMSESAADEIIRDIVPDFEARMLVRAIMRAARHGQGMGEDPITVSDLDQAIRDYGEDPSAEIYPDDMFRFVRGVLTSDTGAKRGY